MIPAGAAATVVQRPGSVAEAAARLRELGDAGRTVRLRGGGTKLAWRPGPAEVELDTTGLDTVLEHNEGDFTAVLEAGVRVAEAQARFARAGQMLALDPWLGPQSEATIGGLVASADSGPLRHRFGGVRDLVVGVTVVLSDGTVARAGGRVIKNVAGYDLGKLFAGSSGALGLIATVSLRLHPLPDGTASARAFSDDAAQLAGAAGRLAALPIEADCLDVAWEGGRGAVLVRYGGSTAPDRAQETARRLAEFGLDGAEALAEDGPVWDHARLAQRARAGGATIKVAATITDLAAVLCAAEQIEARVVARAALGLAFVTLAPGEDLAERAARFAAAAPGVALTVLDGAGAVTVPVSRPPNAAVAVMERLKARFDPARILPDGAWTAAGGAA